MKHKLLALLCAAALAFGLAGCVLSTPDTVGSIGNVEISSGLYLLAQYNAYQSAAKLASSDQDSTNVKSFLKETITTDADSGETAAVSDYVAQKTQENLELYAAIEARFDELGGQLTEAEEAQSDSYASQLMDQYGDTYKANGIGLETLQRFERILLKSTDLLDLVYGTNGETPVSDADLTSIWRTRCTSWPITASRSTTPAPTPSPMTTRRTRCSAWHRLLWTATTPPLRQMRSASSPPSRRCPLRL